MNVLNNTSLLLLAVASLAFSFTGGCDSNSQSARPIKVIVPFGAGGGTDTFARTIQDAIQRKRLLPSPLVIINVPGASGTIGSRRVLNAPADGETILCLHEGMLTAKYFGKVAYGPEAFEPIAGTGLAPLVICVGEDSPFVSLPDLLEAAKAKPDSLIFSASIGAPSHFAGLMLEAQRPGAAFRYTQTGGGAKRFAAIKGQHVDVSAFSLAEYSQFKAAGLRALAVCSDERHPLALDVATAIEQNIDCISENMQFWWAPKGTPREVLQPITDAIQKAMQDPEVRERLANACTAPEFLSPEDVKEDIVRRSARLETVATLTPPPLPDFPLWIGMIVLVLLVLAVLENAKDSSFQGHAFAWLIGIITIVYVIVLQNHWCDFRIATSAFMILLCGILLYMDRSPVIKRLAAYSLFAVAITFGLHALFTQVLVIDLP